MSLPTSLRASVLTLTSSTVSLSRSELSPAKINAANGLMITSLYASLASASTANAAAAPQSASVSAAHLPSSVDSKGRPMSLASSSLSSTITSLTSGGGSSMRNSASSASLSSAAAQNAPYLSVHVIDRIMSLFERLNNGSYQEASVLSDFLPTILLDCMGVEQVLSSVMGEFVSQTTARPFLASVLFKVPEKNLKWRYFRY